MPAMFVLCLLFCVPTVGLRLHDGLLFTCCWLPEGGFQYPHSMAPTEDPGRSPSLERVGTRPLLLGRKSITADG